jgi:lia operon protein LiaG
MTSLVNAIQTHHGISADAPETSRVVPAVLCSRLTHSPGSCTMNRYRLAGVSALAACVLQCTALQAQQTIRLTPSNGRVAIWNLLGTAHIEQGTSSEVEVEITPRGADAAQMITRSGLINGEQTLRIFYPVDEIRPASADRNPHDNSYTTLTLRDDGRFDGKSNEGRRIRISSRAGFEASADLVIRVPANVALDLHLAVGDVYAVGTSRTLTIDTYSGNVRTKTTRGTLNIDTGSGEVDVKGHTGNLSIDTGSGDVDVADVSGARTISLDTGSGRVVVERCSALDELRIDTGSGRVIARNIEARVMNVDTGSGSVEVAPTSAAGSLHVDTGSGSVTLIAPSNFGAELEISAGSGGIRSDLPLETLHRSEGELTARIGDGRSRVSIETGSGGVSIRARL